jgi:hypothetical protein
MQLHPKQSTKPSSPEAKPCTYYPKVDPGVRSMKVSILDKAGKGGSEFGHVTVDLHELQVPKP